MKSPIKNNHTFEEIQKALTSTTGHKKLVNYIREIIKNESFKKDVEGIRKKHDIRFDKVREPFSSGPDVMDDVIKLLAKYHLEFECFEFMMCYVTENEFIEEFIGNMLFVEDIIDVKSFLQGKGDPIVERQFPVVIRVSPYASERDIIDYVRKMYSIIIEKIQDKYKVKTTLGKVKAKKDSVQQRNDLIYKNQHLPRKKIMELVGDRFGMDAVIDPAYIGKIIALENKKRKEV